MAEAREQARRLQEKKPLTLKELEDARRSPQNIRARKRMNTIREETLRRQRELLRQRVPYAPERLRKLEIEEEEGLYPELYRPES